LTGRENPGTRARSSTGRRERRGTRDRQRDQRRFMGRRRTCTFCKDKVTCIDYKQTDVLRPFLTERGRIRSRRQTGTCAGHQRQLAVAIKRARHLALLPFVAGPRRAGR